MQLLEREAQLQSLDDALRDVEKGAGGVALVYGEAGIGKTSLVEEFIHQQIDSYRILRGACDALFTPRPLGPLHDIAQQTRGPLLEKLEATADRTAIFSAALAELSSRPTIMLVEDIHWADEATLDLLKYLGRRVRQTPSLLILTYRDDELAQDHPLRRLLGDLTTSASLHRIPISALSKDAVQELARDKQVDALELHRLTNGNAFYVTEVLAADGGIPETVRDAVLARAAHLSPASRRTLEAAAIIGLRVEPWLLSELADSATAHVDECMASGMLQSQAESYAFRHELARQTILGSMTPHRKADLHRRALEALRARTESREDLARLADHAEGAQDASLILEYAPAAARQAAEASAHREAIALFELALRSGSSLSPAKHAALLDQYVVELAFAGRFSESVPALTEAAELWKVAGEPLRQGDTLANLGIVLPPLGQLRAGERAAADAIAILRALPESPELGRAYKAQCFICMERRDREQARIWGQKSIALAERFQDMDTLARACNYTATAALHSDDIYGRGLMERSLRSGLEAHLPFAVGGTLANLAHGLAEMFRFSEVDEYLRRGMEYAIDHYDDYHLNEMRGTQGQLLFYRGEWDAARQLLTSVAEEPVQDFAVHTAALHLLARLGVRQGLPSAPAELSRIVAEYGHMDLVVPWGPIHAGLAEHAWLTGNYQLAIHEAHVSYGAVIGMRHAWFAGELAFWRWRAGDEFDTPDWITQPYAAQISGDWKRAAGLWEQIGCPYEQGMALMDGDEPAELAALQIFENLGAKPIIEKLKQQMRAQGMRGIPRGPRPSTRTNAFGLTARELDVLAKLVTGASNNSIAEQLSLSTRTVEHHLASILQKTGTQSRGEAVALALRENLVSPG